MLVFFQLQHGGEWCNLLAVQIDKGVDTSMLSWYTVFHFILQNLGLAGSLSVWTVSMTPCSAPRLTIVSALLCSPPPRLVRPVGFARGSLLVTTLLLFRCSDKCLHMKPARWAWDRKYRVIYLTRWTWSKCTRGFFCPSRDMQDCRCRFSQENLPSDRYLLLNPRCGFWQKRRWF